MYREYQIVLGLTGVLWSGVHPDVRSLVFVECFYVHTFFSGDVLGLLLFTQVVFEFYRKTCDLHPCSSLVLLS